MLRSLIKDFKLLILLLLTVLLKAFSYRADWVEQQYTYGIYPSVSRFLRSLFGWIPFSIGDLLYAATVIYLFYLAWKALLLAKRKAFTKFLVTRIFYKAVKAALLVYLLFNVLWGLNYNRQGIAHQLALTVQPYTLADVQSLTGTLQQRLNFYAAQVDTAKRTVLDENKNLFGRAEAAYRGAQMQLPYLTYTTPSIKPSLYTHVGQYFGFTGYYNPFSGEAQLKTTIPVFIKPFVITHEMAHQLGYARENEANFISFLVSRRTADVDFRYAVYYELYRYAVREVYSRDSVLAKSYKAALHPRVQRDNEILKAYFLKTENKVEPLVSIFYDQYLKWNNQQSGLQTYNEVVALLVAFAKKYGLTAI